MKGSRLSGLGEKVNVSPAFLGVAVLADSLFLAELDMRWSILAETKDKRAKTLRGLKFAGFRCTLNAHGRTGFFFQIDDVVTNMSTKSDKVQ